MLSTVYVKHKCWECCLPFVYQTIHGHLEGKQSGESIISSKLKNILFKFHITLPPWLMDENEWSLTRTFFIFK